MWTLLAKTMTQRFFSGEIGLNKSLEWNSHILVALRWYHSWVLARFICTLLANQTRVLTNHMLRSRQLIFRARAHTLATLMLVLALRTHSFHARTCSLHAHALVHAGRVLGNSCAVSRTFEMHYSSGVERCVKRIYYAEMSKKSEVVTNLHVVYMRQLLLVTVWINNNCPIYSVLWHSQNIYYLYTYICFRSPFFWTGTTGNPSKEGE